MRIMGVDPGVTGGVAVMDDAKIIAVAPMPVLAKQVVVDEVVKVLVEHQPDIVVVERLSARPRGSLASWSLAWNTSAIEAIASTLSYPLVRILPSEWKRIVGIPPKSDKGASRLLAKQLFPDWADSFKRVKDDGQAEACLIAEAHRRKNP